MYKVKKPFNWHFDAKDEISDEYVKSHSSIDVPGRLDYVETFKAKIEEKLSPAVKAKVEDLKEDLKDDGKRNYSNRKKKKFFGK